MKTIVVAIHGILTSQTDPSWPDRLDAWMYRRDANVKVLKKEYRAGPFPRWNCWFKDPLLGRGLANEIELREEREEPLGAPASRRRGLSLATYQHAGETPALPVKGLLLGFRMVSYSVAGGSNHLLVGLECIRNKP